MNKLVKKAAEKWALGAITLNQLSSICGDEDTFEEAINYGQDYADQFDVNTQAIIIDLLVSNDIASDEMEACDIICFRIGKGQSLDTILSNINITLNL